MPEAISMRIKFLPYIALSLFLPIISATSCGAAKSAGTLHAPAAIQETAAAMSVSSAGVIGGTLADAYGMRGQQQKDHVPTRSLPVSIKNAPAGTACYAVIMLDPDSKPLSGHVWVHWLAANITTDSIAENASVDNAAGMVQGKNSFGAIGYGGPTPPDKPHTYEITVYALDSKLDLVNGFSKDELLQAMDGHVLAQAVLDAKYNN